MQNLNSKTRDTHRLCWHRVCFVSVLVDHAWHSEANNQSVKAPKSSHRLGPHTQLLRMWPDYGKAR